MGESEQVPPRAGEHNKLFPCFPPGSALRKVPEGIEFAAGSTMMSEAAEESNCGIY